MFAGAAREAVFSQEEVVRRVNEEFVPVALKAAHINNPPPGIEGQLYEEIGRSKPAPQGICVANSAGKVLVWALSFDTNRNLPEFLDYAQNRYKDFPDARVPVTAERFMRFPGQKLADVKDAGLAIAIPAKHDHGDRCPGKPSLERGTLVGRIVGRPLDEEGKPIPETFRQEDYMEARFEVPVSVQQRFAQALKDADSKSFKVPSEFARLLVSHAYLGQLDVNPLGGRQTGGQVDSETIEFTGRQVSGDDNSFVRIRIAGRSDVSGSPSDVGVRTDGRQWEHRVQLEWEGYLDVQNDRITSLTVTAEGHERLRWGNRRLTSSDEPDVAHLMAGHPIDLDCAVRYGLQAKPCSEEEIADAGDAGLPQSQPDGGPQNDMRQQLIGALGPRFQILQDSMLKDLELSEEQRQSLTQIRDSEIAGLRKLVQNGAAPPRPDQLEKFRRNAGNRLDAVLQKLLSKDQHERMRRAELRLQGLFAIGQPEVAEELKLTNGQRQRFMRIVQHMQRQIQSLQQEATRNGNHQQLMRQVATLRGQQEQKVNDVLTETQRARWSELTGK